MKLEHSFEIAADLDTVWAALTDVERVAPCLPGATLAPGGEDGTYEGTFSVKLGPATAAYQGSLEMAEVDETARTTTMRASGRDRRGQGSASATIVSSLARDGEATRVEVITDFTITGRLARFGRGGMIQDVSDRLLGEFASCLQERLAATPGDGAEATRTSPQGEDTPAAPAAGAPVGPEPRQINGLALLFSVLRDRLRRLLRRRPR